MTYLKMDQFIYLIDITEGRFRKLDLDLGIKIDEFKNNIFNKRE